MDLRGHRQLRPDQIDDRRASRGHAPSLLDSAYYGVERFANDTIWRAKSALGIGQRAVDPGQAASIDRATARIDAAAKPMMDTRTPKERGIDAAGSLASPAAWVKP